jgi:GNAT superfamily N-acetyltransferase
MIVRPVEPRDHADIIELIRSIYDDYENMVLEVEHEAPHYLQPGDYFRSRAGDFWVVERDGLIVATVAMSVVGTMAELFCLYVRQSDRRQGLGRMLVEMVRREAEERGAHRLVMWSDTRFTDAHRLYRHMGFTQEGRRQLHDLSNTAEFGFWINLPK